MPKCILAANPAPFLALTFDFIRDYEGLVTVSFKTDLLQHQTSETDFPIQVATLDTFPCLVESSTLSRVKLQTNNPPELPQGYYHLLLQSILQIRSTTIEQYFDAYVGKLGCLYDICPTHCPVYVRYTKLLEIVSNPVLQDHSIQLLYAGVTTRPYLIKNIKILGNLLVLDQYSVIPLVHIGGFMLLN